MRIYYDELITHDNLKAVVLISLEDFNAWQETDYFTRSTANAQAKRTLSEK